MVYEVIIDRSKVFNSFNLIDCFPHHQNSSIIRVITRGISYLTVDLRCRRHITVYNTIKME